MNLLKLAYNNIIAKPLNLLLVILLFGLGIGLINFLLLFNHQLKEKFDRNLADIDLVIGAKGSPLQLILNGMYHIDNPTGNISIKEAKAFLNPKHPLIKSAIPLSLGDNYRTYRIVGTTYDIMQIYGASIAEGTRWKHDQEVVLGATVAKTTGLQLGDTFKSSHGFEDDEDLAHDHSSLRVVGILRGTGSVIDQLILTSSSTVWAVHEHTEEDPEHTHTEEKEHEHHDDHKHHEHGDEHNHEHHNHEHDDHNDHDHHEDHSDHNHHAHDHDHHPEGSTMYHTLTNSDLLEYPDKEITTLLIQYKSKTNYRALTMQRSINDNTDMQAASPAREINRLYEMIGAGTQLLNWLAILIAIVSGISIFITLYKSMKERKYELAIMRVLGGSRSKVLLLIILEGLLLAFLGFVVGWLLSHIAMAFTSSIVSDAYRYAFSGWTFIPTEIWVGIIALAMGILAAFIPAIQASRTDINKTLTYK